MFYSCLFRLEGQISAVNGRGLVLSVGSEHLTYGTWASADGVKYGILSAAVLTSEMGRIKRQCAVETSERPTVLYEPRLVGWNKHVVFELDSINHVCDSSRVRRTQRATAVINTFMRRNTERHTTSKYLRVELLTRLILYTPGSGERINSSSSHLWRSRRNLRLGNSTLYQRNGIKFKFKCVLPILHFYKTLSNKAGTYFHTQSLHS